VYTWHLHTTRFGRLSSRSVNVVQLGSLFRSQLIASSVSSSQQETC
jgi:hypothetical protein